MAIHIVKLWSMMKFYAGTCDGIIAKLKTSGFWFIPQCGHNSFGWVTAGSPLYSSNPNHHVGFVELFEPTLNYLACDYLVFWASHNSALKNLPEYKMWATITSLRYTANFSYFY